MCLSEIHVWNVISQLQSDLQQWPSIILRIMVQSEITKLMKNGETNFELNIHIKWTEVLTAIN